MRRDIGKSQYVAESLAQQRKLLTGRSDKVKLPIGKRQCQCGRRKPTRPACERRMQRTIERLES
jgi:hypothetical protein